MPNETYDEFDKIIFFDENGSASYLKSMQAAIAKNEPINNNRRYFTLTACVFQKDQYYDAITLLEKLVEHYWEDAKKPVVFHTHDIVKKQGWFNFGNDDNYSKFLSSLSETINQIQCEIISITFDMLSYVNQYYKHDPYEVAFDIILGTAMYNIKEEEKVALVFEARGKKEDEKLQEHINKAIHKYGIQKVLPDELQKHFTKIIFNPKISKDKMVVYHGIDIADLCSYPIYRYMRYGTIGEDFKIVMKKLAGYKPFKEKDMRMPGLRKFPAKWQK